MAILLKLVYCLLFGAVAYLLRQIVTNDLLPIRKVVVALLATIASILLISYSASTPYVLPAKSIRFLLQFDFMLVVLFIMQGFAIRRTKNRLAKQLPATPFFEGFFGVAEQLRGTVIFIMTYLFQVVAIWSPVDFL